MTGHTGCEDDTPAVALIVFNRPAITRQTLAAIREWAPYRLFIIADGPRTGVAGDIVLVDEVRRITHSVDWECEVSYLESTENLGIRNRVITGVSDVFAKVRSAIILEDDCVPSPAFFPYCRELLMRYRDEPAVLGIGGHRWELPDDLTGPTYRFSRYPSTWGWATWADRWTSFDPSMSTWDADRSSGWLKTILSDQMAIDYWTRAFDAARSDRDIWDYAWVYHAWRSRSVSIRPSINLVHNIGFNSRATHTDDPQHPAASRTWGTLPTELVHPVGTDPNSEADDHVEWACFSGVTVRQLHLGLERIRAQRASRSQIEQPE